MSPLSDAYRGTGRCRQIPIALVTFYSPMAKTLTVESAENRAVSVSVCAGGEHDFVFCSVSDCLREGSHFSILRHRISTGLLHRRSGVCAGCWQRWAGLCRGDTPHVQVEFSTRSGHQVRDNLATGGTDCGSDSVGKHVVVYYNRASPTDAALGGGNADIGAPGWIGLGLLLYGLVEVGKWALRAHGVRGALATVAYPSTEVGTDPFGKGPSGACLVADPRSR